MPEIKHVWIQTLAPRGDDPGAAEIGFYFVEDGLLTMCDEAGKPTGKKQRLSSGDDAERVTGRVTRETWQKIVGRSDFNRRIDYEPFGYAGRWKFTGSPGARPHRGG